MPLDINRIGTEAIDCAIKVHRALGPGLLESCYQACMAYELTERGLLIEQQKPMPVVYQGARLDIGFRIDILIESAVVLELKSVEALHSIHTAQILTYMKLGGFRLGYLMNFNSLLMKDGIKRLIL